MVMSVTSEGYRQAIVGSCPCCKVYIEFYDKGETCPFECPLKNLTGTFRLRKRKLWLCTYMHPLTKDVATFIGLAAPKGEICGMAFQKLDDAEGHEHFSWEPNCDNY